MDFTVELDICFKNTNTYMEKRKNPLTYLADVGF